MDLIRDLHLEIGSKAWYCMIGFFLVGICQIFNPLAPGLRVVS